VSCSPTTRLDSAKVQMGAVDGRSRTLTIAASFVTMRFSAAHIVLTPDAKLEDWNIRGAGVALACSMALAPFPGPDTKSLLDVLVGVLSLQPDIDRDGDGIETIEVDGATGRVVACVDGDGTHITGPTCPCDPRIADGYSGAIAMTAVPARIVGVQQQP
jgi:hypothetical protein